jgi:tRNA (Thr-GGU) A37 N-methylase
MLKLQDYILEINGVDMLDGILLLDIKPNVPEFDFRTDTHNGWYGTRAR